MRAAVHDKYGPPDLIRIEDVPTPRIAAGEVLIKVHATTVNRTDAGFRTGKPVFVRPFLGMRGPRVKVLGTEFAGVVTEVGQAVTPCGPAIGCSGSSAVSRSGSQAPTPSTSRCLATAPSP